MALTLGACSSSNDPDIPEPTPTPTPTPEPEPEPEPGLTSQGWANDYSGGCCKDSHGILIMSHNGRS